MYLEISGSLEGIYVQKIKDIEAYLKEAAQQDLCFLSDFPRDEHNNSTNTIDHRRRANSLL